MPSLLGKYTLLKTLGSGANSKVKLGMDKTTGLYYAVKILKKGNPNLDHKFLELVMTEVQTMSQLNHPNIVNLIEYGKDGIVEKPLKAKKEPVIYIVLELATGGELFDYVAMTGRFSEKISRFYFHQLIEGLDYVHSQGVTHRDLKPENVLFDQFFNLKIADFGFAAPITGKDGSGYCKTKLGTESYMAPEIHLRKPYTGASVDLFACGIILFIMFTQHPPFTKATPEDPFYKLLCANRADLFWKAHSKNKPNGEAFFSEEFKHLITMMLQLNPSHRLTMAQVKAHPWYTGTQIATVESVQQEFEMRKAHIEQQNEAKRRQKEQERAQKQGYVAQRRLYRKIINRGENEAEEEKYSERTIEEYVRFVQKNTEFFSTWTPNEIWEELKAYFQEKGYKFETVGDKYKLRVLVNDIAVEDEKEQPLPPVEITIKILKAAPEKYCVEFTRTDGDQLVYFTQYGKMMDDLQDLADTTY